LLAVRVERAGGAAARAAAAAAARVTLGASAFASAPAVVAPPRARAVPAANGLTVRAERPPGAAVPVPVTDAEEIESERRGMTVVGGVVVIGGVLMGELGSVTAAGKIAGAEFALPKRGFAGDGVTGGSRLVSPVPPGNSETVSAGVAGAVGAGVGTRTGGWVAVVDVPVAGGTSVAGVVVVGVVVAAGAVATGAVAVLARRLARFGFARVSDAARLEAW
jgi:hypothetical protein